MDFKKKINIGIMGCASIAENSIIPAIKNLQSTYNLVAIASRSFSKAKKLAEQFNCIPIEGYDNLLNENIDAVYIPLPTGLHHEWIIKALNKGKHVYAEKSISITYNSALEMINLAKKKRLALMEGYMFQYHPQHTVVKKLINDFEIGEIRSFRSSFGFPPLKENNFRYDTSLGGGALLDAGGYTLRSVNFILGDDFKVVAATLNNDLIRGVDIFGNVMLTNYTGVAAFISFGFDNHYQCSYELWGSLGKIIVNKAFTPKKDEKTIIILEKSNSSEKIEIEPSNHFELAFNSFYNKILNYSEREEEYNNILIQSQSLDQIIEISKYDSH
jgi:predicted dehydrogenase